MTQWWRHVSNHIRGQRRSVDTPPKWFMSDLGFYLFRIDYDDTFPLLGKQWQSFSLSIRHFWKPKFIMEIQKEFKSKTRKWFSKLWRGFPIGSLGRESTCNAGDTGDAGSIPGWGRSPGGRNGNPLQHSCLENPRDRGAWWALSIGSHRVGHDWSDLAAATMYNMYIWKNIRKYISWFPIQLNIF